MKKIVENSKSYSKLLIGSLIALSIAIIVASLCIFIVVHKSDNDNFTVTYIVGNVKKGQESVAKGKNASEMPVAPDGYKYYWNSDGKNITEDTVIIGETYCAVNISSDVGSIGIDDAIVPFATFDKDVFYVKIGTYLHLTDEGIFELNYSSSIDGYDFSEKTITLSGNFSESENSLVAINKYSDSLSLGWTINSTTFELVQVNEPVSLLLTANGCFVKGTPIAMADGTYKNIEDVRPGDMILTYNAFEGKLVGKEVITLLSGKYYNAPVYKVTLDNGKTVEIVVYQLVFDIEKREYLPITSSTYTAMIGRRIMVNNEGEIDTATIVSITVEHKTVEHYDIYSSESISYIAGDIIAINYLYCSNNPFIIGEDYKIDMAQLTSDCEEYGYFTYDDFCDVCSLDTFNNFNIKYLKAYMIKNNISMDTFKEAYRLLQSWIDESLENYK